MTRNWLFYAIFLVFPMAVHAAGPFGLGLIIGDPTGVTAKAFIDKNHAVDGALAWHFGDHKALHVHSDYLWHKQNIFQIDGQPFTLFYGLGARFISWDDGHPDDHDDDVSLGPRGPVGLSYTFKEPRIEVFGELALVMEFIPGTDVDFDFGVGGRFYF